MDAATHHDHALCAAEGYDVPQDWHVALDHLARAATLGHALAQRELALLSGDTALATELAAGNTASAEWDRLCRSIDVAAWTRTPPAKILSVSPRVALVESIASDAVCDWLVTRTRPLLAPARLYDPGTGGATHGGARTNREHHFPWQERDLIFAFLRARIQTACGLPVGAMEAPTILHYGPGQEFMTHYDFLDPARSGHAMNITAHGQRVLTFLVALNDGYEGGETDFPALGKRFKGRKGNALFFWNVEPDGTLDRRTLHAGLPPSSGEKWMFSQWIRDRLFAGPTAQAR